MPSEKGPDHTWYLLLVLCCSCCVTELCVRGCRHRRDAAEMGMGHACAMPTPLIGARQAPAAID